MGTASNINGRFQAKVSLFVPTAGPDNNTWSVILMSLFSLCVSVILVASLLRHVRSDVDLVRPSSPASEMEVDSAAAAEEEASSSGREKLLLLLLPPRLKRRGTHPPPSHFFGEFSPYSLPSRPRGRHAQVLLPDQGHRRLRLRLRRPGLRRDGRLPQRGGRGREHLLPARTGKQQLLKTKLSSSDC